jgi:uncharacterized protein (DUF1697 family)
MKYLALLRGINVGGNSIIKMVDLKEALLENGFLTVKTFIQSGNVLFESAEQNTEKLTKKMEDVIVQKFCVTSRVVIRSELQLTKILENIPDTWEKGQDLRCYIAFVIEPTTAQQVAEQILLKEGIDSLKIGDGALYMTTQLSGITMSSFSKLASKKIYKEITIRNYTTMQKIATLMKE